MGKGNTKGVKMSLNKNAKEMRKLKAEKGESVIPK